MNPKFSDANMQEYKDTFMMWDRKGDSKIAVPHIGHVMRSLLWNPTEKAIKKVIGPDRDEYDRVDWETFLPMMKDVTAGKFGNENDFVEGLKVFDKDNSSTVNCGEIRHVLSTLGERLEEAEVDVIIKGMEDKKGMIQIDDIVKKMMTNVMEGY
ncbi:myosin light chain 3, skeletal muscle isoform isoform X3 [Strongylocentrotus purpuratus]|uniref:EF-hand domain-containing protein n=1 Tax=Strongylocentrotus purpuratus TaxID=7668 RepID=A0A7M7HHL5_STRPU|nr:myosin light chain 3, skeletal muscle isoform isoform X3 [Strongylocentrotus purpuratus]|eukprot:XP_011668893.1 PREDICTED: myosin light chain 3, skeletal muscle isoform isoform X3 [Strongylocentrotus purpuratus]